jgi:hypothetical protein
VLSVSSTVNLFQKGVKKEMYVKILSCLRCSDKETSEKMGTKQLVSSAWQCTCTLVTGGQTYLANHNVMALEHVPYSSDLSSPNFSCFYN